MKYWIQPSNPHGFDANAALTENGYIMDWPTRRKMEVGDIVFLYFSSPMKQILWMCEVAENVRDDEHDGFDDNFWGFDGYEADGEALDAYEDGEDIFPSLPKQKKELMATVITQANEGHMVKFVAIHKYQHPELLSLARLREHGLKSASLAGAQTIKGELLDYILGVERNEEPQKSNDAQPRYTQRKQYPRSSSVAESVKEYANGFCELCGKHAPFFKPTGEPYLETHHIIPLSEGGPDTVNNVVALCPNCHMRMHHAKDTAADVEYLKVKANKHR